MYLCCVAGVKYEQKLEKMLMLDGKLKFEKSEKKYKKMRKKIPPICS